jgi:uncharacterized low-complexity protein
VLRPRKNPFAPQELDKGYGNTAGAASGKTVKEMSCGEGKCGAAKPKPEVKVSVQKAGEITCGAKMMKGGEMACGANMAGMEMWAGSQMEFNPILSGSDFYHVHPEGMWMFNYKFMHMEMSGLQDGLNSVPISEVIPMTQSKYGYMMAPTQMSMDMQMLMGMYGITDRLTVMAMVNYQTTEMNMDMNMEDGKGNVPQAPMRTQGVGDTELDAIYALTEPRTPNNRSGGEVFGTIGFTLPTGSISQTIEMMGREFRAPYGMQNGSGTVDFKPSLSYHYLTEDALWLFGTQATYTYRIGTNAHGYARGNNFRWTGFAERAFGKFTALAQLTFNDTAQIQGSDPDIDALMRWSPSPDADPANYGGQRLDANIGISYERGPFSLGVSGGAPVYQYLNGLQMPTRWILNAGFQAMF